MRLPTNYALGLVAAALAVACSRETRQPAKESAQASGAIATDATRPPSDSAKRDSAGGMAGMDHSKMGTAAPMTGMDHSRTAPAAPMAGVDHSKMAPSTPNRGASARQSMTSMDHSQMPGMTKGATTPATPPASNAMAGMDHSKMTMGTEPPPATALRTTTAATSPMDHSAMGHAMPGTPTAPAPTPNDLAEEKLRQIVARLIQDSVVLQRIQADTVLRNRWQDSTVRRLIIKPK